MCVQPVGGEDPRRRKWQPTVVFLPEKSHGPWQATVHGVKKSQTRLGKHSLTLYLNIGEMT